MIKKKCLNCKFWDWQGTNYPLGLCRKDAPKAYSWHYFSEDEAEFGPDKLWALTDEDDWCGEWVQRRGSFLFDLIKTASGWLISFPIKNHNKQ